MTGVYAVTQGWNRHQIRVSTQSYLEFSCCSCWNSNLKPFNYVSGALSTSYPGSEEVVKSPKNIHSKRYCFNLLLFFKIANQTARKQRWTYHSHRKHVTLGGWATTRLYFQWLVGSSAVQLCGSLFTRDVRVAVSVAVRAMCCRLLSLPQVTDFRLHVLVKQNVGTVRQRDSSWRQLFHSANVIHLTLHIQCSPLTST